MIVRAQVRVRGVPRVIGIRTVRWRIVAPVVAVIRAVIRIAVVRPRSIPVRVVPPGIQTERPVGSPEAAQKGPSDAKTQAPTPKATTTVAAEAASETSTEAGADSAEIGRA